MDGIKNNTDAAFRQVANSRDYSSTLKEGFQPSQIGRISRDDTKSSGSYSSTSEGTRHLNQNTESVIEREVEKLNESVELIQKKFKYRIHKDTNRLMIQVVDSESKEIIKEIPPEKILDMVAKIEKMIGLIIDEKI